MQYKKDGIILVGMSGRAPKADNLQEFWNQLMTGEDMTSETTPRWPPGLFGLPRRAGIVPDISRMDAEAFGLTEEQVNNTDPQQRLMMQTTMEAIFDSGLPVDVFSSGRTGVFVHVQLSEYGLVAGQHSDTHSGVFASRLAGMLKSNGPAMTLDSACSSALVGLHVACTQLHHGIIDFAVIAGSNLLLSPVKSLQSFRLGMLSAESASRPWDQSAKGYVRAEGVYSLVVTRRDVIPYDPPRAYAEVVASATNSDGYTPQGITYPSKDSQAAMLADIYSTDGVDPKDLAYVECHATGTQAGDPVETEAICEVICTKREGLPPLLVGTCKSNMGHAEWTAGLASVCKALLCINKRTIPPNVNLENVNVNIPGLTDGRLQAVTAQTPLPDGLVGVTSSGFGGSNCHMVLRPLTDVTSHPWKLSSEKLVLLGSRTEDGLLRLVHEVEAEINAGSAPRVQAWLSHLTRAVSSCSIHLPYRQAFLYGHGALTEVTKGTVYHHPTTTILHLACVTTLTTNSEMMMDGNLKKGANRTAMVLDTVNKLLTSGVVFTDLRTSGLSYVVKLFLEKRLCAEECVNIVNAIETWMEEYGVDNLEDVSSNASVQRLKDSILQTCNETSLTTTDVDLLIQNITPPLDGGVTVVVDDHVIPLVMTSHGINIALAKLYCLGVPVLPIQDANTTVPWDIPPIGHLLHWDHRIEWPMTHWIQFCNLGADVTRPPYVIPHDVTSRTLVYYIWRAVSYFQDAKGQCVCLEHFSPPSWDDVSDYAKADIYCLTGGKRALVIKGDQILMQAKYQIMSDEEAQTLFTEDVNNNSGKKSREDTENWEVTWTGNWGDYIDNIVGRVQNRRVHSVVRAVFDSRRVDSSSPSIAFWNSTTGVCSGPGLFVQFMTQGPGFISGHVGIGAMPRVSQARDPSSELDNVSTQANFGDHTQDSISTTGTPADSKRPVVDFTPLSAVPGDITVDQTSDCNVTPVNDAIRDVYGEKRKMQFKTPRNFSVNQMMVHCLRLYHCRTSSVNESWILAFCGKQNGKHCLGVSAIQLRGMAQSLCSPFVIPVGVSCIKAVSSVVPYVLADGVISHALPPSWLTNDESSHVVIVTEQISLFLINLLRNYVTSGDKVILCLPAADEIYTNRKGTVKHEIKVVKSSPEGAIGEGKQNHQFLGTVAAGHTFHSPGLLESPAIQDVSGNSGVFTSTPTVDGQLQMPAFGSKSLKLSSTGSMDNYPTIGSDTLEKCFIDSTLQDNTPSNSASGLPLQGRPTSTGSVPQSAPRHVVLKLQETTRNSSTDSLRMTGVFTAEDEQSPCVVKVRSPTVQSLAAMFPDVIVLPLDYSAPVKIRACLGKSRINVLINLTDQLSPWVSMMEVETVFLQVGVPHPSCNLGIGMCKSCGTFKAIDPVSLLQQMDSDITESGITLRDGWTNGLWAATKACEHAQAKDVCYQYTSNPSTTLVSSVSLQVVYKHVIKMLQSGTTLDNLNWLGHLKCLASLNNQNTSACIPRHRSMIMSSRANVRARSPVPQVYVGDSSRKSATPINLDDSREDAPSRGRLDTSNQDDSGIELRSPMIEYVVPLSRPALPSPLVALNEVNSASPLFLVHPVTGVLNILRWLGQALTVKCYGIQQTVFSSVTSIQDLAKYYLDACLTVAAGAPLRIAGYSFGGAIAFEMALQAQAIGQEVAALILLDGSPVYVKLPLIMIREANPPEEVEAVMETELMLAFIQLYSSVDINSVRNLLRKATNRLKVAVECTVIAETMGSCLNQWLVAAHRALNQDQSGPDQVRRTTFVDVSQSVLYNNRLERAHQFVNNMTMVDKWRLPQNKFQGDIHLLRLCVPPRHCVEMPVDYGLTDMCTGQLFVKTFSTSHEGLVLPPCCNAVAAAISGILEALN